MRLIAITAFASLLTIPAHADTMKNCAAAWKSMSPADQAKTTYKDYSAVCLNADYKAMSAVPPTGTRAQCKDGTYSTSKTAKGRCSGHGGVAKTL
jgi:hypothetical protein